MKKVLGLIIFCFMLLLSTTEISASESEHPLYPYYISDQSIAESFVFENTIEGLESIDSVLTEAEFNEGASKVTELIFVGTTDIIEDYGELDKFDNLTDLYLYQMELEAIPAEIYRMSNIEYLGLYDNNIASLDGIEQMTSLKGLGVNSNQITSFDQVLELENLKQLDLSNNDIESFAAIQELTSLEYLTVRNCEITSFDGLENLINLKELDLSINKLTSLHGIENLVQLESILLSKNEITSIDSFENLVNLNHLELNDNPIGDIESLSKLENLEVVDLTNTNMTSIDNLLNSEGIKDLYLSNNQITSIEGIEKITNLMYLSLSHNKLDSQTNYEEIIGDLIYLQELELSGLEITSLTFLDALINLTVLGLSDNNITTLEGVENLTNIETLYLDNNQIEDIKPLEDFVNLREIDLSYNEIESLEHFPLVPALSFLDLSYNDIKSIEPLRGVSADFGMFGFFLEGNHIVDFEPIHDNKKALDAFFTNQSIEVYLPKSKEYSEIFQLVNCPDETCNFIPKNYTLNEGEYSQYISHEFLAKNNFSYSLFNNTGGGIFQEKWFDFYFSTDITIIPFNEVTLSNTSDYISEINNTDIINLLGASITDINGNDLTKYLYVADDGGLDTENPNVGTYEITLKFNGNDDMNLSQLTNDYEMVVDYEVLEDSVNEEDKSIKETGFEYNIPIFMTLILIISMLLYSAKKEY